MSCPPPNVMSVVVPIGRTQEKLFINCLNSLTNQSLSNVEFVLVFDGDNTELETICKGYQNTDRRFVVYKQPHLGVSAARNYGISKSNGEYVAFVDADDTLFSEKTLELSYLKTKTLNGEIVLFDWSLGDSLEKKLWNSDKKLLTVEDKYFCLNQLIHTTHPSFASAPWAKLYHREFLTRNNIVFDESCVIGEDRVFNFIAFLSAQKISYAGITFYKYVVNDNSSMRRFRPGFFPLALNYIERLCHLSNGMSLPLIGRETIMLFYLSWKLDYMNPQNTKPFFLRMKEMIDEVKSSRFQMLIKEIDKKNLSTAMKIETLLLQHKITFWLYIHGLKRLFFL